MGTVRRQAFRTALASSYKKQMTKNLRFLKGVALFNPLLHDELVAVSDALESVRYDKGQVVIRQGDLPEKFYVIKGGVARWEKKPKGWENMSKNEIKDKLESGSLKVGSFFGELALMNNDRRAASVVAETQLICLEMGRKHFNDLLGP